MAGPPLVWWAGHCRLQHHTGTYDRSVAETDRFPDPRIEPLMTIERAGKFCGVGKSSAYAAAARGDIPSRRFGRRLLVPTAELARLLGLRPENFGVPPAMPAKTPEHQVGVAKPGDGSLHVYRARCSCGWTGQKHTEFRPARLEADQHAAS